MKQILFVCTGNTCRSPMAEAAFKVLAEAHGLDLQVKSAGVCASPGCGASYMAEQAVKDIGGDLTKFQSTQLTGRLIAESTLIVTMTAGHRREILTLYPKSAGKVWLLTEFDAFPVNESIADPYGGSLERYRGTLLEMLGGLNGLIAKIEKNLI